MNINYQSLVTKLERAALNQACAEMDAVEVQRLPHEILRWKKSK